MKMKSFYKGQVGKYFVVRTYSHTDHKQTWKILTRPITDIMSADVYREVESKNCPEGQEVFIVKVVTESDAEIDLSRKLNDNGMQVTKSVSVVQLYSNEVL